MCDRTTCGNGAASGQQTSRVSGRCWLRPRTQLPGSRPAQARRGASPHRAVCLALRSRSGCRRRQLGALGGWARPACDSSTATPSHSDNWCALTRSVTPPPFVRKQTGYSGCAPPLVYSLARALWGFGVGDGAEKMQRHQALWMRGMTARQPGCSRSAAASHLPQAAKPERCRRDVPCQPWRRLSRPCTSCPSHCGPLKRTTGRNRSRRRSALKCRVRTAAPAAGCSALVSERRQCQTQRREDRVPGAALPLLQGSVRVCHRTRQQHLPKGWLDWRLRRAALPPR